MASAQQAARITDPVTHGLGMAGIIGGMLVGAVAGAILIAALPATAPALVMGLTAAAAGGAVAGGGLAGNQLLQGIQRACALPSPTTGLVGIVGSPNVRIVKLPAARVIADLVVPCNGLFGANHMPIPPLPPVPIAEGSQTIRINNLLAARVSSKIVCGASIKQGALTVYYGGPTQRVLAVVDVESMLLGVLAFLAKVSLVSAAILTVPLGLGAMALFGSVFAGFLLINHGAGKVGDSIGPGWRDILQGGLGLATILGGAKIGADALERSGSLPDVLPSQRGIPINGATRTVPLGFQSDSQFLLAATELQDALRASGVDDAVVGVRGSSVTGQSFTKGTSFGPQSDIDFFVESDQLTSDYTTSKGIQGFVHPNKILPDYPLLQDWSAKWTSILGRVVTPGGFVPGTVPDQPAIIIK